MIEGQQEIMACECVDKRRIGDAVIREFRVVYFDVNCADCDELIATKVGEQDTDEIANALDDMHACRYR